MLRALFIGEDNKYPSFMKLHVLQGHKPAPSRNASSIMLSWDKDGKVSTDNDTNFMWLKDYVDLVNSRVDYCDRNHMMNCSQQLKEQH